MKLRFVSYLFCLAVAALLTGCGDPAPSTPLAPDQPAPDTSKFSQADIDKFHQQEAAQGSDRLPNR
ncbi:MAG: hypothetical protein BGO01_07780 [Armatimonadetes bacterium 55-13]|nr:hypothetical protein [Armatimonadota bacterium]OJU63759.1 MAG: hypothetical protein BGO01_07780 [Armatimonadetes bacterium 55-13]